MYNHVADVPTAVCMAVNISSDHVESCVTVR